MLHMLDYKESQRFSENVVNQQMAYVTNRLQKANGGRDFCLEIE